MRISSRKKQINKREMNKFRGKMSENITTKQHKDELTVKNGIYHSLNSVYVFPD